MERGTAEYIHRQTKVFVDKLRASELEPLRVGQCAADLGERVEAFVTQVLNDVDAHRSHDKVQPDEGSVSA